MQLRKNFAILALIAVCGFILLCKKEEKPVVAQIVGTKYSNFDQWIYKKAGTADKAEQVELVYGMEEVTGLEIVPFETTDAKGNKSQADYLKLKTVSNKEGFALLKNFSDAVLFVTVDGDTSFAKPSITSPSKGKLIRGMYCLENEVNGEFSNVNCYGSIIKNGKIENYYKVWIQPNSPNISKDPLLGDTVKNLRKASMALEKFAKSTDPAEQQKLQATATEALKLVVSKADQFLDAANAIATEYGLVVTE
ncbi:lipoprotein LenA [Leptospira perolatii]|uniref:Lipoprotein LenA n=1 Tax=Leptospira perolatii TaxID=2023191 RepID=A0A2M9ZR92_9LEPT|nr:lipoprotein LenA [Leptospira perolatii]PJZ71068.1 lipoprotein LenA [Leptospira perolatii]PJZ74600.1 lipoprotein LenA [Leptospira perolatii]